MTQTNKADLPDIDIEAERAAYREWRIQTLRACGMYPGATDQRDTDRLDGWLARARLAAEREREMRATIDRLQADLTDAKCAIFNITPQRTVDDLKDTLDEQIGFLWPQIAGMEKRLTELETLLKRAHHPTCSMNCPSHVEISEGYGHCELCRKITEALKGPSDDQRRA